MTKQPTQRQIHLDFHTSGDIPNVAAEFDGEVFAQTALQADVDSVNVFAKCHHGYSYYPTEVGTMHPGLKRDLLGEQIAALNAVGIRAPIYVSVLWDDLAGVNHPEWIATSRGGRQLIRTPLSNDSVLDGGIGWTTMDLASGYADYVAAQVRELCERYPVDGFWFDIVSVAPSYAPVAQDRLRDAGVDLSDEASVHEAAARTREQFMRRLTAIIHEHSPDATVFYNHSVDDGVEGTLSAQTHLEVESLPTSEGLWGYLHYPLYARFARSFGVPMVGMTGRFHKSWADFGGLKNDAQLAYECATIVAAGGAVSIGDQLDPSGVLDPAVYRTIGRAYRRVRELEPWLVGAQAVAEVAILADYHDVDQEWRIKREFSADVEGAALMLLELGIQFNIVHEEQLDAADYRAVIIPDGYRATKRTMERLGSLRARGVKLIVSGLALFDSDAGVFGLQGMPCTMISKTPTVPSFLRSGQSPESGSELAADYDYAFYDPSYLVAPTAGTTALGQISAARFNRTWENFTSHAQAPVGEDLKSPWGVMSEGILYFAAPLFGAYRRHDYWVYKELVRGALAAFLSPQLLKVEGPAWVEATLQTQPADEGHPERSIVHLVAYQPRRVFSAVQRVDSSAVVGGLSVLLTGRTAVSRVYLAPSGEELDYEVTGDGLVIEVPALHTHAVVVVE